MAMSIVVTTAATSTRLVTLETMKRELDITDETDDKKLDSIIQRASDYVARYTGHVFARESVTEKVPGDGTPILVVTRTPIVSITKITDPGGSTITSTEYSIDDSEAGILFNELGWLDTTLYDHNIVQTRTRYKKPDWIIEYTGGYVLPGSTAYTSTGPALPGDLEQACVDIVKYWYLNATRDPGVKAERTGDASETKFGNAHGIPPAALAVLDGYRRADI